MCTCVRVRVYFLGTLTPEPPIQDLKNEDNIVVNIPMEESDPVKMTLQHALMSLLYSEYPPPLYCGKSLERKKEIVFNGLGLFNCPENKSERHPQDKDRRRVLVVSVCVCVCIYPVCIRHEETFRHPWASGRIVVHQVGVSSHYSVGRSANPLNAPFSFKSSASKKVREGARVEGGRLGLFAVAGSKKRTFKQVGLRPR